MSKTMLVWELKCDPIINRVEIQDGAESEGEGGIEGWCVG